MNAKSVSRPIRGEGTFQGRAVLPGRVTGAALVSRRGFNTLASFQRSFILRSRRAISSDQDNPDLYGKLITGLILCLPQTIGSTSGGLALEAAAAMGIAPAALLFSQSVDTLAASGLILADVWLGRRIVTVDRLGAGFLESVRDGQIVDVFENGTVRLS